jgi:hypothetical protein
MLVNMLAPLLVHPVPSLRVLSKVLLEDIAERTQRPMAIVLQSIRNHLLSAQTVAQLQAMSVSERVGVLSAIAYCLQLQQNSTVTAEDGTQSTSVVPYFTLNEHLLAVLEECLKELNGIEQQLGFDDVKKEGTSGTTAAASTAGASGSSSATSASAPAGASGGNKPASSAAGQPLSALSVQTTTPNTVVPIEGTPSRSVPLLRLRLSCMQLLIAALGSSIVREDRDRCNDLRVKSVRAFFRGLFGYVTWSQMCSIDSL